MIFKTKTTKASEIKRDWHLFDASGQILGRLSTQIATTLIGKDKVNYVPYLDCGDNVVVVHAAKIRFTGRKLDQKKHYSHSGYPGGFKEIGLAWQMEKDPTKVIRLAVSRMLPKNKHRKPRLARLKIYTGDHDLKEVKFAERKITDGQK